VDADIVVSEILLAGLSGYELARRLAARTGAPPVLLCTRIAGTWPLPRAIRSGALGFVGLGEGPDALAKAIRHVAGGGRLWGAPARGPQDDGIRDAGIEALTPRHFETLHLLLQGMDDAAVANAMNVTRRSAAANRRSVLSGLRMSDAAQLTRVAPLIDDAFYAACRASVRMV
jgi:DNA-binding NarL/FixJ family response regulator